MLANLAEKIACKSYLYWLLAPSQWTVNQRVAGSSPAGGATKTQYS